MGKYMKKTKIITGEVAVMDVAAHQALLGVRTRARTLALQRLQKPPPEELEEEEEEGEATPPHSSYLQLRSRRLEKPKPKDSNPNPRSRANSGPARSCRDDPSLQPDAAVEVSFGDNVLEAEARDRTVRETTPCSLIRNSESIRTPGSTTRPTNSSTASSRRMQSWMHSNIPTAQEMEEFFSGAEQMQQRMFTEKYNFDPVNDIPLPGRYEWVKLDY